MRVDIVVPVPGDDQSVDSATQDPSHHGGPAQADSAKEAPQSGRWTRID